MIRNLRIECVILSYARSARCIQYEKYSPVVVQQDGAVKVGQRHGAASLVVVPLCTPHVSAFRPVEREREREKGKRHLPG
jgi:hypothetical protein